MNQCRCLRSHTDSRMLRSLQSSLRGLIWSLNPLRRRGPLDDYQRWLAMEAAVGARSTFLFLPHRYNRPHYTDGGYRYSDAVRFDGRGCTVAGMMREIHRRGWEVGLHASWQSFDSAREMRRQKEQVETAIGADVASVRQHHLHFDIRHTARVQHRAGLLFDSSLGFNDNIGFRCETSYPWRLRDMQTGQPQGVLELPLAIQDKCLMRTFAHGSEELALEWLARLAARVKHVCGLLTLLWHPESLHKPPYVAVYQRH